MAMWYVTGLVVAFVLAWTWAMLRLGRWARERKVERRDTRRSLEQREWRDSGRLPDIYETTYKAHERVVEDIARMESLGFYVAMQEWYVDGSGHVVYRREGAPVLL